MIRTSLMTVVFVLGACNPDPLSVDLASRQDPIIGGTTDSGDPEILLLVQMITDLQGNQLGAGFCTGTHIAPKTILTAAHCADEALFKAMLGRNDIKVQILTTGVTTFNPSSTTPPADMIPVVEKRLHPNWNPNVASPNDIDGDIALLLLESASSAPLKEWNTAAIEGYAGKTGRMVGYGQNNSAAATATNAQGAGTRRQTPTKLQGIEPGKLQVGNKVSTGMCHGDSGGPTLFTFPDGIERVVGVHSYTLSNDCLDGMDTRVDHYTAFIQTWLDEKEVAAACAADGICAPACMTPDSDPDCLADGKTCTDPTACAGQQCVSGSNGKGICAHACEKDADCPTAGTSCNESGLCVSAKFKPIAENASCAPAGMITPVCIDGATCVSQLCLIVCTKDADCGLETCSKKIGKKSYCAAPVPTAPTGPSGTTPQGNTPAGTTGCAANGSSLLSVLGALFVIVSRRRVKTR